MRDAEKWHRYLAQVDATIIQYGGEVLLRGLQHKVMSNQCSLNANFERFVVLRFESMEALNRWHDSSEYRSLKALRAEATDVTVVTYQTDSHYIQSFEHQETTT